MRVAYVCADPDVPAFANRAHALPVREMCVAMLEAGLDLSLFVANRGGETPAKLAGVPVTHLRASTANDPDAQAHEAVALNGEIASALANSAPFDIIYERASRWSVAPMHYAAKTSAVGILELHAPVVHDLSKDMTSLHTRAARALLRHTLCSARLVVTGSREIATRAQTIACSNANIHVIAPGCDPRSLAQLSGERSRGHFVVGYVGALSPDHGLETLVDAFATLVATNVPHAQLLIIGEGPQRNELVKRAARLGLADSVTFTNAPVDGLSALLAKMNVAVAPHTDQVASISPTLTECMAAGLPVVASANTSFRAVVDHDRNGVLFQPGDSAGLASILGQLHADPLRLRRLGHKARSYATAHFTWGSSLERILALAGHVKRPEPRLDPERTLRGIA